MPPDPYVVAARIVNEAGGELVGRTKLQKVACLAQLAGYGEDFEFEYRHYGPFSEDLARAMDIAVGLGLVREEVRRADWGGRYSVYTETDQTPAFTDPGRARFIAEASRIGPIALELAATAAYLCAVERVPAAEVWNETARRKPEKANTERLSAAKSAYRNLEAIETPKRLPDIL